MKVSTLPALMVLVALAWSPAARGQEATCSALPDPVILDRTPSDKPGPSGSSQDFADKINSTDCEENEVWRIQFDFSGLVDRTGDIHFYEGTNCYDASERTNNACVEFDEAIADAFNTSWTYDLEVQSFLGSDCAGTERGGLSDTAELWFVFYNGDGTTNNDCLGYAQISFTYDMEAPAPPTGLAGTPGDSGVSLSWTHPSESGAEHNNYRICYISAAGGADGDGDADADGGSDGGDGGCADVIAGLPDEIEESDLAGWTCVWEGGASRDRRVSGLSNSVSYAFVVATMDDAGNLGVFTEPICVAPAPVDDFYDLYVGSGGESGFCFVATVAYGGQDHPDVRLLRWFRDRVLLRLPGGTWLVGQYYAVGPTLADLLGERPGALWVVRQGLELLTGGLRILRTAGAGLPVLLALGLVGLGLIRRRRSA